MEYTSRLAAPANSHPDGSRPACVGRERELERLVALYRETRAGGVGRVAHVSGVAGIGKSRLVDELIHRLREDGALVLEGHCRESAPPYQPVLELVEAAVRALEQAGALGLAARGREVVDLMRGRGAAAPVSDEASWQLRRLALFETAASFLVDVARPGALALIVHDLHFADASTHALVAHLCETRVGTPELDNAREDRNEKLRGLVVLTSRADDATWLFGTAVETLPLGALDTDGVRAFLQSPEVVAFFAEATGGRPRSLEALLEAKPTDADELLRARLQRLTAAAHSLVSTVAVFGRAVGLDLLRKVAGVDDDDVASSVVELVDARLLAKSVVAGELRLGFSRTSDEEAVYRALPELSRGRLHLGCGRALAAQGGSSLEEAVAVAEHLLRAGAGEEAVDAAVIAGERLEITFGYDRAIDLFRRAYGLTARDDVRALLEARLCELERLVGEYGAALTNAQRLLHRCPDAAAHRRMAQLHILRDELQLAKAALDRAAQLADELKSTAESARVRAARAEACFLAGENAQAKADCNAALALGSEALEPHEHLSVRNTLGKVLLAEGSYLAAADTFSANVAEARTLGRAFEECRALYNLGIAQLRLGNSDQAQARYQAALKVAEAAGDHRNRAFCLQNLGVLAHWKNDYATALGYFHDAVSAFKKIGQRARLAWLALDLGSVYLDLCVVDRAEAMVQLAERLAQGDGAIPVAVAIDREQLAGRVHERRGELEKAQACFETASKKARESDEHERSVEAELQLAKIEMTRGELAAAVARLEALQPPASQGSRARMLLVWGELELLRGELLSSRRVLLESAELFHRLGDLEGEWRTHLQLGRAAAARHDPSEAERRYRTARAIDERVRERVPEEHREAHASDPLRLQLERALGLPRVIKLEQKPRLAAVEPVPVEKSRYPKLVGRHARLQQVFALLDKIAPHDSLVLIRGESGTGKELIADALHAGSARKDRPLIKVNCGALVETLLLSELFGHERGSFTGALQRKKGRFEMADGGTIFLDEIGDISPKTQVALLRVLQEREFERVGGNGPIRVDVRIICATNRNLEQMVARGEFREDLYYRLKGIQIELPALRERIEDVPVLVEHFLARVADERAAEKKSLSPEALELLMRYSWPGNVRELENVLRSVSLFAEGTVIGTKDFADYTEVFRDLGRAPVAPVVSPLPAGAAAVEKNPIAALRASGVSLKELKTKIEIECIREALDASGGNITRAAERLGMKRPRLSQLVKQYGIAASDGGSRK